MLAYEPAKRLARLNIDLNSGLVGVRVLFDVIDHPPTEQPDEDKPPLKLSAAHVEFAKVQFAYRPGEKVIRSLSFVAEPGSVTALVGPSGGGKSTILNLILRFYEIDAGVIAIDGQDIAAVSRRSLRSQVAYVGQDVFLFRGSVRENIALGRPGATEAEIVAAAKAAYAHDFIMAFPRGYDTPVGEHGMRVAGGERQRISVARALLKDAPVILLDEATASLDFGVGATGAAGDRASLPRANDNSDRAPPAYRGRRPSHLRHRGWNGDGIGTPRRPVAQERALRLVLPLTVAGSGTQPAGRHRILRLNSTQPKESS